MGLGLGLGLRVRVRVCVRMHGLHAARDARKQRGNRVDRGEAALAHLVRVRVRVGVRLGVRVRVRVRVRVMATVQFRGRAKA